MSRFHGKVGKGALRDHRATLRTQAEDRQKVSDPRKAKAWRLKSTFNPATGKREPWSKFPIHQRNHESRIGIFIVERPELSAANA